MSHDNSPQESAHIAMKVFTRWARDLKDVGFTHSDGEKFHRMLKEAFANSPLPDPPKERT